MFPLESNGATRRVVLDRLRRVNARQRLDVARVQHSRQVYAPSTPERVGGLVPNTAPDPMADPAKMRLIATSLLRSADELKTLADSLERRAAAVEATPEAYR